MHAVAVGRAHPLCAPAQEAGAIVEISPSAGFRQRSVGAVFPANGSGKALIHDLPAQARFCPERAFPDLHTAAAAAEIRRRLLCLYRMVNIEPCLHRNFSVLHTIVRADFSHQPVAGRQISSPEVRGPSSHHGAGCQNIGAIHQGASDKLRAFPVAYRIQHRLPAPQGTHSSPDGLAAAGREPIPGLLVDFPQQSGGLGIPALGSSRRHQDSSLLLRNLLPSRFSGKDLQALHSPAVRFRSAQIDGPAGIAACPGRNVTVQRIR